MNEDEKRTYGTCLSCTQSVSMVVAKTKPNVLKRHSRKVTLGLHIQAIVTCRGSFEQCAEQIGCEWDPRPHMRKWVNTD